MKNDSYVYKTAQMTTINNSN